jgi:hypothetical protein
MGGVVMSLAIIRGHVLITLNKVCMLCAVSVGVVDFEGERDQSRCIKGSDIVLLFVVKAALKASKSLLVPRMAFSASFDVPTVIDAGREDSAVLH